MNDMSAHPAPKSDWAANLPVPPRPAPPRPTMGAQSSGIAWSLIAAFALHGAALAALTGLNLATGSDPKPLSVITVDLVALTPSAPAGGSAAGEADTDTDTPANEATDKTESPSARLERPRYRPIRWWSQRRPPCPNQHQYQNRPPPRPTLPRQSRWPIRNRRPRRHHRRSRKSRHWPLR